MLYQKTKWGKLERAIYQDRDKREVTIIPGMYSVYNWTFKSNPHNDWHNQFLQPLNHMDYVHRTHMPIPWYLQVADIDKNLKPPRTVASQRIWLDG